jgi:hypothetical protein
MSSSWIFRRVAFDITKVTQENIASIVIVDRISEVGTLLAVQLARTRRVFQMVVTDNALSSLMLPTLMKEAKSSSETSAVRIVTYCHVREDGILHPCNKALFQMSARIQPLF